jgi:hypothetical protein
MVMDFDEWLRYGVEQGFCSEQFCVTHDGGPWSGKEELMWEDGEDPCRHMVRLGTEKDWDENL